MTNFVTGADRDRIQDFLHSGETLLWCAKPEPPLMPQNTFITFLMGLVISSTSPLMALQLQRQDQLDTPTILFLSVFFVVGLLLTFYMPFATRSKFLRTLYIISDRRAIILPPKGDARIYPLAPYMVLSARTPEGKLGRIIFEREVHRGKNSSYTVDIGFLYCPEAAEALSILEKQLDNKALESSKTAEVRRQEREREDIQKAALYKSLVIAQTFLTLILIGSIGWLLFCVVQDATGHFPTAKRFDTYSITLFIIFFMTVASVICDRELLSSRRGRKLLQQKSSRES